MSVNCRRCYRTHWTSGWRSWGQRVVELHMVPTTDCRLVIVQKLGKAIKEELEVLITWIETLAVETWEEVKLDLEEALEGAPQVEVTVEASEEAPWVPRPERTTAVAWWVRVGTWIVILSGIQSQWTSDWKRRWWTSSKHGLTGWNLLTMEKVTTLLWWMETIPCVLPGCSGTLRGKPGR